MRIKNSIVIILFIVSQIFITNNFIAQINPDSTNFRSPINIPLIVAGNFGEVRSNHFHTGMDFKTQGVIGKNIYAIDNGYVSRIAFSHYGYGRAIYITHPNGYTSVYAHLSKFKKPISDFVRNHQYTNQKETFNVYLDSGEITVSRGQIVALSGNSGSSSAPHLHFEIRETISENPVNPLLFGYKIIDNKKPMINNLKVYPLDSYALVNGKQNDKVIRIKKNKQGAYFINEQITAYGNVGFALHSTDRLNARNICGLYSLDLSVNGDDIYSHKLNKLDFSTNRYVNHHVDYLRHKRNNQTFHKSFLKGNNLLKIYNHADSGFLYVNNDSIYKLQYTAKDFAGNKSIFSFKVKGDSTGYKKITSVEEACENYFHFDESNYIKKKDFNLIMTENTLYEDLCFNYKTSKDSNFLSSTHHIDVKFVGVHKYYKIFISPSEKVDSSLHSKLLIVKIDENGKIRDKGGDYEDGVVTTRVREFGKFAVTLDTIKPTLIFANKQNVNSLKKNSNIDFIIGDNLSGIKSYSAHLNGKWILSNYKRKKNRLVVPLSEKKNLSSGTHKLVVKVIDEKGNVNSIQMLIYVN